MYEKIDKVNIELTDKCNSKCPQCHRTDAQNGCKPYSWIQNIEWSFEDFKKAFEKRSKELGYGREHMKVKAYKVQVSKPAGFDKAIKYETIKGLEIDYRFPKKYDLNAFIKDMKKGFSGYKVEKTGAKTHFYLHKGGNVYNLAYTPSIAGTYAMGSSRV